MKLESTLKFRPELMLVVPMFDVIGSLLLFFLLGSSLVFPSGVRVELPPSSFALQGLADAHVLILSAGSPAKILLADTEVKVEDLETRFLAMAAEDRRSQGRVGTVVIKADKTSAHGLVSRIKNTALKCGFRVAEAGQSTEED